MTDLRLSVDLEHPAELVWRALTDRRLLSLWFVPTDLAAVQGGVFRAVPPPGLAGFTGPFDVDVIEVSEPDRLVLRWRGDELHSDVTWELTPAAEGCRLLVGQTGFFGVKGTQRRRELGRTYQVLFGERLPATLDRLARGEIDLSRASVDLRAAIPRRRDRIRAAAGRSGLAGDGRQRLLSLVAAVVLVILVSTATAVLMVNQGGGPVRPPDQAHGPGTALQPGTIEAMARVPSGGGTPPPPPGQSWRPAPVTPTPIPIVSAVPEPSEIAIEDLTAGYKTIALLGLGGFDTEVTVRNPGLVAVTGWSVVLTMLGDRSVVNRSPTVVAANQEGATVTLIPVGSARTLPAGGTVTFTIRFPALLALGKAVKSCTIDGRACTKA